MAETTKVIVYLLGLGLCFVARAAAPDKETGEVLFWIGIASLLVLAGKFWGFWGDMDMATRESYRKYAPRALLVAGVFILAISATNWDTGSSGAWRYPDQARWGMGVGGALIALFYMFKRPNEQL